MSVGDDRRQTPGHAPGEDRFVGRLRIAAGSIMLLCIAFLVVAGTIAGHVDATVVGILSGAILALVGVEVPKRLGNGDR